MEKLKIKKYNKIIKTKNGKKTKTENKTWKVKKNRKANPKIENPKRRTQKWKKQNEEKWENQKWKKTKSRKIKNGKVKNQKRKKLKIKNKLLKIKSKLVLNIIEAISPRLKSEILNEIIRLILSKAELVQ